MNPKAIRHIIGWSGLIVTVGFVAGFMSFFFNLSRYDINIRWVVIPCVALTLFLLPKVKEWVRKGRYERLSIWFRNMGAVYQPLF